MRHFAIFYTSGTRPDGTRFFADKLGSDGIAYMDNRHNLASMKEAARTIGRQRAQVAGISGFRIARGTRIDSLHFLTAAVIPLD